MSGPLARIDWRAWAAPGALFLLAFLVRWSARAGAIYGDEGFHYYISRTWGAPITDAHYLDWEDTGQLRHLFFWRPAFMALLTPGALVSFDAYRLLFIAYTSLLPVLAVLILRDHGVRAVLSYAVAGLLAVHPYFVVWGVRVFPDELMATAFAAGLWAWTRGWAIASGVAFLLSVWCKESAIVGVAAVLGLDLIEGLRSGRTRLWPARATRTQLALAAACGLGLVPLYVALNLGLTFPGWGSGGELPVVFDRLFVSAWLIPFPLVGLLWPRTRRLCLLALVYPAFYLARRIGWDRSVEIWYYALPSLLVLLSVGLVLDEGLRRTARSRAGVRALPIAAAALVALLMAVLVLAPAGAAHKEWTMPASRERDLSLAETLRSELERDRTFPDAFDQLTEEDRRTLFALDVGWFFVLHPLATHTDTVRWAYTGGLVVDSQNMTTWAHVIETLSNASLVLKYASPINEAVREVYRDCVVYENPDYVLIRGAPCSGRGEALVDAYEQRASR